MLITYCSNLLKGPAAAYEPIVKDTEELMSLALKCIYACDRYKNVALYVLLYGRIYDHELGIDIHWF